MSKAPCVLGRSPVRSTLIVSAAILVLASSATAQIPPGYYDSVDTGSAAALRQTLHQVIDDHQRFPYTSSATDTWDILELADEDPSNAGNIIDVYRNSTYPKQGGGNSFYNREHTWPSSYGFPNDNASNQVYTDCHMLRLVDDGYNSARSNKPYGTCDASCTEEPTDFNNVVGGGTGVYPGNSNWTMGSFTSGTWETWIGRRGDVARSLLYCDVRYEGGVHGVTGIAEPDLILTDNSSLIQSSNTGSNLSVAYMGMLTVLIAWHNQDPVDDQERARNDVVYAFQGNRNPFVDHPEWVACVFEDVCGSGDTTPPQFPTGLMAVGGDATVTLDWDDNAEPDLAGYRVYRSTDGISFSQINTGLAPASAYADSSVVNGTTYIYAVTAVDLAGNESVTSLTASATPSGPPPSGGDPWINEFHYDNDGADTGEFFEIAGPAGTDLSGWSVVGYNGSNQLVYQTVNLSGTIPNQQSSMGTVSFAFTGMQNGSPDGLALVNGSGQVVEFLSYEGSITAADGPAAGMTSVDVGVSEVGTTPIGMSLQRVGTGSSASDFTWQGPANDSPGQVNAGQTLQGGGGPRGGTERYYVSFTGTVAVPGLGNVPDEDIVAYDPSTDTWEMYFDGSDVGVTADVNAFHVRQDGSIILSLDAATSIPGLTGGPSGTSVDDSDLVLFTPTNTGDNTAGSFSFLLDGSDIGLSTSGEDIDGVFEFADGDLAISTTGSAGVTGLSAADEDVMRFSPTSLGASTAGSFSLHFDGSDVGFGSSSNDDLCGIALDGGELLFTTLGTWSGIGASGEDEDVGRFTGTFGSSTSGTASLDLDLSALGVPAAADVDGLSYRP